MHFIIADQNVGFYEMFILCFVLSAECSICRSIIKRQYYQIMALEVYESTVRGKCGAGGRKNTFASWFFRKCIQAGEEHPFKSSQFSDIRVFVPAVS